MAKKRPLNWQRGAPRPITAEPQPLGTGASGTADVDFGRGRSVDSTWDPSQPQRANFAPISPPPARARRGLPVSASWVSVGLVAVGLLGGAILYVAGMRTDIAVAGARIDSLQKSQDAWTADLRVEIRKVESALEARLNRLSEIVQGRRPLSRTNGPAAGQPRH